jgi:hypothetical protein
LPCINKMPAKRKGLLVFKLASIVSGSRDPGRLEPKV